MKIYTVRLILFFLLAGSLAHAQTFSGRYRTGSNGGEDGYEFLTFKNKAFTEYHPGSPFDMTGKGTYAVRNNQLILTYEQLPERDSSAYAIKSSPNLSNRSSLVIKTYEDGSPILGCWASINTAGQLSSLTTFDKSCAIDLTDKNDIKAIYVSMINRYPVYIPVKDLAGKESEATVHLKHMNHQTIPAGKVSFRLLKTSRTGFTLLDKRGFKKVYKKLSNK